MQNGAAQLQTAIRNMFLLRPSGTVLKVLKKEGERLLLERLPQNSSYGSESWGGSKLPNASLHGVAASPLCGRCSFLGRTKSMVLRLT